MQFIDFSRSFFGRIRISLISAALLIGTLLPAVNGTAQQTGNSQPPSSTPESHGTAERKGTPTSLRELVQEAEQKNPQIAASYHGWQAARNVPKQVSAFPETQVSVQQFSVGSPRPFAGFSNSNFAYIGIGASQDLPFPGKRGLRGKVAEFEAASLREDSEAVRRRAVENLKLAYFQLAYLQQTLDILEHDDQLLNQVQQVVESRYRVGQANQQDVLKAQLQHTKILQEIAHHHQEVGQLDAQLLQRVQDQNPNIRSRQQMVQGQEARVDLAHKDFRPDFMVEYMYQRTDPTQYRAYYMATFGIRLPNRGRQKAELAEAEQNRERVKQELQGEVQRVSSEVEQQYVMVRSSEERLNIYKGGLIPQSDANFRAGMAAYQANREDFETLLGNFLDVLNLDLEYRQELAEHESALARLERLTGVTLP